MTARDDYPKAAELRYVGSGKGANGHEYRQAVDELQRALDEIDTLRADPHRMNGAMADDDRITELSQRLDIQVQNINLLFRTIGELRKQIAGLGSEVYLRTNPPAVPLDRMAIPPGG